MRNGWPHTGDGQEMTPADQGNVPFGPGDSWPTGYSAPAFDDSGYRYETPQAPQLPASSQGAHPYAAFNAAGYGDDGYRDPGYQGPSAQDAGIAGTRTVRGFLEPDHGHSGYPLSSPVDPGYGTGYQQGGAGPDGYGHVGYAESSYTGAGQIEIAYPPAVSDSSRGSDSRGPDLYSQPWDYEQPLRYEGDERPYQPAGHYQPSGDYGRGYQGPEGDGPAGYQPPVLDQDAYNGSEYSMPGINGPGYDLSGIIGTDDFEAIGYDEPSYGRLSYDDPRYEDGRYADPAGYAGSGSRFDETCFDETRLDNLWLASDDVRRESGYGDDRPGDSRPHSDSPSGGFRRRAPRSPETRADLTALTELTRFDLMADETRLDNLSALTPGGGIRRVGAAVLAPPATRSAGWSEDTSLDLIGDLDLADEPVPSAFTRTLDRPQPDQDTGARRTAGRRRGRSGDRRQWMALGAIAVVAAGAIGGVLMKYVFSGPSGPTHQVIAPQTADGYTRSANLEKQLQVKTEAEQVVKASSNQASDVVAGVYQQGSISTSSGGNAQIFMFVGGKLAGADPGASVTNFEQTYKGAKAVSPGALGGEAACTTTSLNNQSAAMCVWFDNDTFGTVVSPTMTTDKLAATMDAARPSLELLQK